LVGKLWPKLHSIYEAFDTELNGNQKNPKTLDDLLGALIPLATSIDEQAAAKSALAGRQSLRFGIAFAFDSRLLF
jgi:hypothetical protein